MKDSHRDLVAAQLVSHRGRILTDKALLCQAALPVEEICVQAVFAVANVRSAVYSGRMPATRVSSISLFKAIPTTRVLAR